MFEDWSYDLCHVLLLYLPYKRNNQGNWNESLYCRKFNLINTMFKHFSLFLAFAFCQVCMIIRFFHPRHNGQWPPTSKSFYPRFYPLHLFCYLNSWERASIFPFECSVLNKGTTGTIFITSLVWRGFLTGDWTRDLPHSQPAIYH